MTMPSPPPPPSRRFRWRRPRGRGAVLGAALLALLVVGGVAAALLIPGRGDRGAPDDIGLAAETGELAGADGPGRGEGRGRGGPWGRGLGDDTLLAGTVVSTADGSLVVTLDGGAQRTIRTDDDTRVRGNGNAALGDLAAGERVVVRVSGTGDAATAESILTPRARVTGTVTELSGDTATVTAIDGLTATVDVAGVNPKPVVGDLVVLSGVADGTTIAADQVRVLPKAS